MTEVNRILVLDTSSDNWQPIGEAVRLGLASSRTADSKNEQCKLGTPSMHVKPCLSSVWVEEATEEGIRRAGHVVRTPCPLSPAVKYKVSARIPIASLLPCRWPTDALPSRSRCIQGARSSRSSRPRAAMQDSRDLA